MAQAEAGDDIWGCGGILVIIAVGWLLIAQGPVSWFLAGALVCYGMSIPLAEWATREKKDHDRLRDRLVSSVFDDSRSIFRNLAIGLGGLLVVQLFLNLTGAGEYAQVLGTSEQRLWNALSALKSIGTLQAVALVTLAALALSFAFGSLLPFAIAGKVRKWISTAAAVLASMMMFSFVTAQAADQNFTSATAGIRAHLADRMTSIATARREAVAYRWISATVEAAKAEAPENLEAWQRYFAEGASICQRHERAYQAGLSNPRPLGLVRHRAEPLCDQDELLKVMARRFAINGGGEVSDAGRAWLPEFRALIRPPAMPYGASVEIPPRPLAELEALAPRVEAVAKHAEAAREMARGLATKSVETMIGKAFAVEGAAGKVVDVLLDAALSEIGKRGEARIRNWLELIAGKGQGLGARLSTRTLTALFPGQPLMGAGITTEKLATRAAMESWKELHPTAATLADAHLAGRAVAAGKGMKFPPRTRTVPPYRYTPPPRPPRFPFRR